MNPASSKTSPPKIRPINELTRIGRPELKKYPVRVAKKRTNRIVPMATPFHHAEGKSE
jgi:hypothetical protein